MSYVITPIISLENFRKQLNGMLANIFGAANSFTAVQTFPTGGIVIGTVKVLAGTGSPEGAVTAPVGSVFLRTNGGAGTSMYIKESGSGATGWVGK